MYEINTAWGWESQGRRTVREWKRRLLFFSRRRERKVLLYHGIGVNINTISTENIKEQTRSPAGIEARRGEDAFRGGGQGMPSGRVSPAPLAVCDYDSVAINSQSRALQAAQDQLRVQVPVAQKSYLPVEEDQSEITRRILTGTTVNRASVVTNSEIVRDSRTVGPYALHVNSSAMKRYGEASSYRNWQSTTFELTV